MAPTVTRLILSFALLVATPTLFFVALFFCFEVANMYYNDGGVFLIATIGSIAFLGLGWWLIWKGEVKWTGRRTTATLVAAFGSLVVAGVVGGGFAAASREEELGLTIGGLVWIVLYLFGTALAWRETKAERQQRLEAMGVSALPCPSCAYNLSGLRESRCPECGASFTLDQLYAAVDEQRRAGVS